LSSKSRSQQKSLSTDHSGKVERIAKHGMQDSKAFRPRQPHEAGRRLGAGLAQEHGWSARSSSPDGSGGERSGAGLQVP